MYESLEFRKLTYEEFLLLINWAKDEGWNPGINDGTVFWETDPEGYYGVFFEDLMIGGGSIVSYDGAFGFMGFFIIHPKYRGNGIGEKLWVKRRDLLLDRLKSGASIGMDGVVAMQEFYKKGGFTIAFRDERYENTGKEFLLSKNIKRFCENDFSEILKIDLECFGFSRKIFLKSWLHYAQEVFLFEDENKIKGFSVLRKAQEGYKIGPLFAENKNIAEELYKACLNAVPEEKTYIDIPIINSEAVQMVKEFEATYVFECARMYYGAVPKMNIDKVFGITTFELG